MYSTLCNVLNSAVDDVKRYVENIAPVNHAICIVIFGTFVVWNCLAEVVLDLLLLGAELEEEKKLHNYNFPYQDLCTIKAIGSET